MLRILAVLALLLAVVGLVRLFPESGWGRLLRSRPGLRIDARCMSRRQLVRHGAGWFAAGTALAGLAIGLEAVAALPLEQTPAVGVYFFSATILALTGWAAAGWLWLRALLRRRGWTVPADCSARRVEREGGDHAVPARLRPLAAPPARAPAPAAAAEGAR